MIQAAVVEWLLRTSWGPGEIVSQSCEYLSGIAPNLAAQPGTTRTGNTDIVLQLSNAVEAPSCAAFAVLC